jgi:hypothetical protein
VSRFKSERAKFARNTYNINIQHVGSIELFVEMKKEREKAKEFSQAQKEQMKKLHNFIKAHVMRRGSIRGEFCSQVRRWWRW